MYLNLNYHQKLNYKVNIFIIKILILKEWIDELDDSGIDFVKKCIQVIERRGLDEQGLYRVVGMQSKVNSLVAGHFGNS